MIIDAIMDNPTLSTIFIARHLHLPKNFALNALNREELYPYHIRREEELEPEGYVCTSLLRQIVEDPNFINKKLITRNGFIIPRASIYSLFKIVMVSYLVSKLLMIN